MVNEVFKEPSFSARGEIMKGYIYVYDEEYLRSISDVKSIFHCYKVEIDEKLLKKYMQLQEDFDEMQKTLRKLHIGK